jgi:alpha-beta hydrolase superfamily lysophospholipase
MWQVEHVEFKAQANDGLQMHFQGWQPEGQAKAVVCLVHGIGEHCGRYAHVGAALAQAGYALIGCDLRGHGKSEGPRGHTPAYDAMLEDISLLLGEASQRYADRPRFLYGHSMGGGLVLNYVLRRRPTLAGAVVTSPWLRLAFEPPGLQIKVGRMMDRVYPGFTMPNNLDIKALSHDPEVCRAYQSDPLIHNRVSARLGMGMMDAGQWALEHALAFSVPLLLMHGGADRITSVQASQAFAGQVAGDCTLKIWEGFYHETHNEPQRAEVLAFMTGWLNAHCPGEPVTGQAAQAVS